MTHNRMTHDTQGFREIPVSGASRRSFPNVHGVAKTVAQEIECHHGDHDGQARDGGQVGRDEEEMPSLSDHRPPGGRRRSGPQPGADRAMRTVRREGPRTEGIAMARRIPGKAKRMSASRMKRLSTFPANNPAADPTRSPTARDRGKGHRPT